MRTTTKNRASECRHAANTTCVNACTRRPAAGAFTLIELLVIVSIIAILIGVLLPALAGARDMAQSTQSLSNLRQIGIAAHAYTVDHKSYFFMMSSAPATKKNGNKPRWADYLFPYVNEEKVYLSPNLDVDAARLTKQFWHTSSSMSAEAAAMPGADLASAPDPTGFDTDASFHGGYGYNYQYLGNSRTHWVAKMDAEIRNPTLTILAGDTAGSNDGNLLPRAGSEAAYTLDPPCGSLNLGSKGSRGGGEPYYASSSGSTTQEHGNVGSPVVVHPDSWLTRSVPAYRNISDAAANMVFLDGHAEAMTLEAIDDQDGNGNLDHGHWNGLGRADETNAFR